MAYVPLSGHADPDVQLGLPSPTGSSSQRRGRGTGADGHDPRHEWASHLHSLPLSETHQVVKRKLEKAVSEWKDNSPGGRLELPTELEHLKITVPQTPDIDAPDQAVSTTRQPIIQVTDPDVHYGSTRALKSVSVEIPERQATPPPR